MTVSQVEVDALKREVEALGFDSIEHDGLETTAERIAFVIFKLRAIGTGESDLLDSVELFARAGEFDREDLRNSRDTLRSLHYGPALIKLLTRVARRAPLKPEPFALPGLGGLSFRDRVLVRRAAEQATDQPRHNIDTQALALARRPKRRPVRR